MRLESFVDKVGTDGRITQVVIGGDFGTFVPKQKVLSGEFWEVMGTIFSTDFVENDPRAGWILGATVEGPMQLNVVADGVGPVIVESRVLRQCPPVPNDLDVHYLKGLGVLAPKTGFMAVAIQANDNTGATLPAEALQRIFTPQADLILSQPGKVLVELPAWNGTYQRNW